MKKFFLFCGMICAMFCTTDAFSAAKVLMPKKADAVAKRDASTTTSDAAASILPTVVGLVGSAMTLSQQQKALVAECEPSKKDVAFVNSMVKEWANAGGINPIKPGGVIQACGTTESPFTDYQASVLNSIDGSAIDSTSVCWDVYTNTEARGAVWAGFPKAAVAEFCSDGTNTCNKNSKKKVTNLWDIWEMIPFDEKDFTKSEATQALALQTKADKCSDKKLAARRLETYGGFVKNAVGNIGQTTNTGSIMETVSGIVGQTGIGGTIGGLAPVVGQFLDK